MSEIWRDLEHRRGHVERTRENSTRPGRAWATYKTTGTGFKIETKVFPFGAAFVSMPIFTFGVVLDPDGPDLPADDPPRCTAGVYDWRRAPSSRVDDDGDMEGYYTGAFCWFTVDSFTDVAGLKMIFTLAFEGIASKDFISTPGFPMYALEV